MSPLAIARSLPRRRRTTGRHALAPALAAEIVIGWAPPVALAEAAVLTRASPGMVAFVVLLLLWQLGAGLPLLWLIRPRLRSATIQGAQRDMILALRRRGAQTTVELLDGRMWQFALAGLLFPTTAMAPWLPFLTPKQLFGLQMLPVSRARYPFPLAELACALHLQFGRRGVHLYGLRAGTAKRPGDAQALVEEAVRAAAERGRTRIRCHSSAPVLQRLATQATWFDRVIALQCLLLLDVVACAALRIGWRSHVTACAVVVLLVTIAVGMAGSSSRAVAAGQDTTVPAFEQRAARRPVDR